MRPQDKDSLSPPLISPSSDLLSIKKLPRCDQLIYFIKSKATWNEFSNFKLMQRFFFLLFFFNQTLKFSISPWNFNKFLCFSFCFIYRAVFSSLVMSKKINFFCCLETAKMISKQKFFFCFLKTHHWKSCIMHTSWILWKLF